MQAGTGEIMGAVQVCQLHGGFSRKTNLCGLEATSQSLQGFLTSLHQSFGNLPVRGQECEGESHQPVLHCKRRRRASQSPK